MNMKKWLNISGPIALVFPMIIASYETLRESNFVGVAIAVVIFSFNMIYIKCINPNITGVMYPKTLDFLSVLVPVTTLPFTIFASDYFIKYYLGMIQPSVFTIVTVIGALLGRPITKDYAPPPASAHDERVTEIMDKVHFLSSLTLAGFFLFNLLCSVILVAFQIPKGPAYFFFNTILPNTMMFFVAVPFLFFEGEFLFKKLAAKKYGPDWQRVLFPEGLPAAFGSNDNDNVDSSQNGSLTESLLPGNTENP